MKEVVSIDGKDIHSLDIMNPVGMYKNGQRQRGYSKDDMLPLSGKLISEFDGRRSIRDMFTRHPSVKNGKNEPSDQSAVSAISGSSNSFAEAGSVDTATSAVSSQSKPEENASPVASPSSATIPSKRRSSADPVISNFSKRAKSGAATAAPAASTKGQKSLKGFFKPKASATDEVLVAYPPANGSHQQDQQDQPDVNKPFLQPAAEISEGKPDVHHEKPSCKSPLTSPDRTPQTSAAKTPTTPSNQNLNRESPSQTSPTTHDPIVSAQSWSKLFTKPAPPRCESHNESCITMLTKKPGINNGRSFWMCARPLGPSGAKEKGTQWRCGTFIWCSDWNPGKDGG